MACLDRHLRQAHPVAAARDSVDRACAFVRARNRELVERFDADAAHRERVTGHIEQLAQGGELCVFGAGNGDELDLERLARLFSEIHLVDLDAQALERARDRQPVHVRAKLVLQPEVDCSGMLQHLDAWGERFPERAELAQSAVDGVQGIVRGLGRGFSVVVSACVLGQLALPFQRAWLTSRAHWGELLRTLNAVHLATLTGSLREGGRGLIVFDTSSSKRTPALAELGARSSDELEEFVAEAARDGGLELRPDPRDLVRQLLAPGLRAQVANPELSAPWLWQRGPDTELVYGLTFRHPD